MVPPVEILTGAFLIIYHYYCLSSFLPFTCHPLKTVIVRGIFEVK